MKKIKFIRGSPSDLYRSSISFFYEEFKERPLDTCLLVPRSGMATDVRSDLLRGMAVPTFCVTDLDDLVNYLYDRFELELRPIGGLGARYLIRSILLKHKENFPSLIKDGEVRDGILDDLYTTVSTLRDFEADLSRYVSEPLSNFDIPAFVKLFKQELKNLGLIDSIGKRELVAKDLVAWCVDRPLFKRLVILGQYEPTSSQVSVIKALVQVCDEVVYHHPFVHGYPKVFLHPILDLGCEMDVVDIPIGDDEAARLSALREWGDPNKVNLSSQFFIGKFLDPLTEARQVAESIARLIESGEEPGSIAVFLPERGEALPLLREVMGDFDIPFETDMGVSISTSPMVQAAIGILDSVLKDYSPVSLVRFLSNTHIRWEHEKERLWHADVDTFARMARVVKGRESWSSCIHSLVEDLQIEILDPAVPDQVKERSSKVIPLVMAVGRSLDSLFTELDVLKEEKTFLAYINEFQRVMSKLGMDSSAQHYFSEDPDNLEGRAFLEMFTFLEHMKRGGIALSDEKLPLQRFVDEIKKEIGDLTYRPEKRWDSAVHLGGYRSLSGRNFKHSFMAFTIEGDMPHLAIRSPFLTVEQYRSMGLLDDQDILRQERFYFLCAMLSGSDDVHISYPSYKAGKRVLPSPFLSELDQNCVVGVMQALPIFNSKLCAQMNAGTTLLGRPVEGLESWLKRCSFSPQELCERINVESFERRGPYYTPHDGVLIGDTAAEIGERFRNEPYSATMLEKYNRCPMYFLFYYVNHLKSIEDSDDDDGLRLGNIAHEILFRFYRSRLENNRGPLSDEMDIEAVKAEMRVIGHQVINRYKGEGADSFAQHLMLIGDQNINGSLGAFIDRQAAEEMPHWNPEYLEYSFGMKFSEDRHDTNSTEEFAEIRLSDNPEVKIRLKGRVDRIDKQGNHFFIIDYKNGNPPTYVSIERGYNMQLPLYLMACQQLSGLDPVGAGYYSLKYEQKVFGLNLRIGSLDPWYKKETDGTETSYKTGLQKNFDTCRTNVQKALKGILKGDFHPIDNSDTGRCNKYCPYLRICRKDDMRVLRMSLGVH